MARDELFATPAEKLPEEKSAPDTFKNQPLAARMRPRNLDEYAGQSHILGAGQLLRRAIEADRIQSLIFYGPPGTGKTSLAQIIARHGLKLALEKDLPKRKKPATGGGL